MSPASKKITRIFLLKSIFLTTLANSLCLRANIGPGKYFFRILLNVFDKKIASIESISRVSEKRFLLRNASESFATTPDFPSIPTRVIISKYPSLEAHLLHKAIATPHSPGIIINDTLLLPSFTFNNLNRVCVSTNGMFYLYKKNVAISKEFISTNRKTVPIKNAVLINTSGTGNWYHFIIQCLPKVLLSQALPLEFKNYPILVPLECRYIPSFADALALFNEDRPIKYVESGSAVKVENLIVIDDVNSEPYNMYPGLWPHLLDYGYHKQFVLEYIHLFRRKIELQRDTFHNFNSRRIFLKRPNGRRNYNQTALIKIAKKYSFEPISLEESSLIEQAHIFNNADIIIGPSGAAWTGMIFREAPAKGLSWLASEHSEFCSYSSLAGMLGHKIIFIETSKSRKPKTAEEVYWQEYNVSEELFESQLIKLIEE